MDFIALIILELSSTFAEHNWTRFNTLNNQDASVHELIWDFKDVERHLYAKFPYIAYIECDFQRKIDPTKYIPALFLAFRDAPVEYLQLSDANPNLFP